MKLIIQPDAGITPVVQAIHAAKKTLEVCIFRLDRDQIAKALGRAVQRGVDVRALIAFTNKGGEARLRKLEQQFLEMGVTVSRTADDLLRYHGKYVIADSTLHVFGFNFTKTDIEHSRGFGVSTRDASAVREARKLFAADCARQPYVPGTSRLVVSPESSRKTLLAFVKGARRELAIYDMAIADRQMIDALKKRHAKRVHIRVIGSIKGPDHGIEVRKLAGLRLHARVIVRDGTQVFVGSQSLRKNELDNRREVGLIVRNPEVARRLRQVFDSDWQDAGGGAKVEPVESAA